MHESCFWTNLRTRQQPWSTYAVHQTTLTHWALSSDFLLVYLCFKMTSPWDDESQWFAMILLFVWMLTSKFIKLLGHYIRYPADFLLLPVSIAFGYLHGFIKVKAMVSLTSTTWGSREGADTNDAYRMVRVTQTEKEKPDDFHAIKMSALTNDSQS